MIKKALYYLFLLLCCIYTPLAQAEEKITLSTYYPAPYGEYDYLAANSMVVGRTYPFPAEDNLIVEGNVGIGTTSPNARLTVKNSNDSSIPSLMVDRSWDGTRVQFQYAGSLTDLGEIGMTSNSGVGNMRLWMGANLNSVGGHANPTQNSANSNSWYSQWSSAADSYSINRIAASGGTSASTLFFINGSGNVGIGTTSPSEKLEVNGNITGTPIMGTWYPTAHGPNDAGGQHIYVVFNAEQEVTDASYFTNLGGTSGIRVNKAGYYHVEFVTLVYLGGAGDYGHVYLRKNGTNIIDLEHSHYAERASWDDRHNSWKGYMAAGDYIQVSIYHQVATTYWYHAGPLYTRLTIQRLN